MVFGADVIADGWNEMTRQAQLKLLTDRLKSAGKGILLQRDSDARRAAVLPAFPRYLRDNRDRLVHVLRLCRQRLQPMSKKVKNVNNSNN